MKLFIENLKNREIRVANGNIHQLDRNALKRDIKQALGEHLELVGFDTVLLTNDGVGVMVELANHTVVFTLDPVIKNDNYDLGHQHEMFLETETKRIEREQERIRKAKERENKGK